jgi:hypothetical protein
MAIGVLCLLAGTTVFVATADRDPRPKPQFITEFAGVRLGMSPTEVTLSLGRPFASSKIETDAGGHAHLIYVYSRGKNDDHSLDVTFHGSAPSNMHAAVVCDRGGLSSLLGFDKFSREQDVLRVLGNPNYSSIRADGLEKTISYSAWNASLKSALGKVVGLCIHKDNFIQYDKKVPADGQPRAI